MNDELSREQSIAIVVDDKPMINETFSAMLEETGFKVYSFDNEAGVFDKIKDESPHIVLVHFSADIKRSIKFISELHSKDRTICIIYTTAYHGEDMHQVAIKSGAYIVIKKPIDFLNLREVVIKASEESSRRKTDIVMKKQVFVVMPYSKEFDEIYTLAIKDPLEELGFICQRADEMYFTGNIIDTVHKRIEQAEMIVADMTGKNANVFYEIGYAHALRKPVVLLAKEVEDIPFDLHTQKHIVYGDNMLELRKKLKQTVETHSSNIS